MDFLEKDLEDIIWEASQEKEGLDKLKERGFPMTGGRMYRQVNLGNYGILDLVSVRITRISIDITIYELKKNEINISTMLQASRYGTGIREFIENKCYNQKRFVDINYVLIGKEVDTSSDFVFLYNAVGNFHIYLYKYSIDGIKFIYSEKGWRKTDADIPNITFPIKEIKAMFFEPKNPY